MRIIVVTNGLNRDIVETHESCLKTVYVLMAGIECQYLIGSESGQVTLLGNSVWQLCQATLLSNFYSNFETQHMMKDEDDENDKHEIVDTHA